MKHSSTLFDLLIEGVGAGAKPGHDPRSRHIRHCSCNQFETGRDGRGNSHAETNGLENPGQSPDTDEFERSAFGCKLADNLVGVSKKISHLPGKVK